MRRKTYPYPLFGDPAVNSIDTALAPEVLEPIWAIKAETASPANADP